MTKINNDLLLARGFKNEKELNEFLKNCNDESWIKELKDYYGLTNEDDVVEEENKNSDEENKNSDEENKDDDTAESDELQINKKPKNKVKEEI